ncbi:hypothetical protein RRG08_039735 [Elysia crispata]|uniref:Uncharacterized protein n=1 Tax=Elysia crispata TaxID=231223 RepID=A0AAE0YA17_9GAST|nr:hypothetical protein RRG08_039735 [Elysia crispata]
MMRICVIPSVIASCWTLSDILQLCENDEDMCDTIGHCLVLDTQGHSPTVDILQLCENDEEMCDTIGHCLLLDTQRHSPTV